MSTHYSDIASALDARLDAMGETVAWENIRFVPATDGSLHLRQHNMPASTMQSDLGASGQDYTTGLYQIDVVGIAGKGKAAIYTLADQVADQFKRGTSLTYNGVVVRVSSVERTALIIEDKFAFIPLSIEYEAYTAART